MGYCTRAEVREMLKDDTLNVLLGNEFIEDAVQRESRIAPIIDAAIDDADGEVDGYLAKRYPVPLLTPPKVINKYAKDIAVYQAQRGAAPRLGQKNRSQGIGQN